MDLRRLLVLFPSLSFNCASHGRSATLTLRGYAAHAGALFRLYSTTNKTNGHEFNENIKVSDSAANKYDISSASELSFVGAIPKDKIKVKFTLGSGPGGQNVNKIATKAEIRFNVDEATWIPEKLRKRFMKRQANQINQENEWIITSIKERSKAANLKDCFVKLKNALHECSEELVKEIRQQTPSDEDIEVIKSKVEQAKIYRRMEKERRAQNMRMRNLF